MDSQKKQKNTVVSVTNNTQYIVAVIAMLILAFIFIIAIAVLRPDADLVLLSGAVFGFLTPATLALLAFMKAQETYEKAQETHLSVNSRLDEFIKNAEIVALEKGKSEGRKEANERTDRLKIQNRKG